MIRVPSSSFQIHPELSHDSRPRLSVSVMPQHIWFNQALLDSQFLPCLCPYLPGSGSEGAQTNLQESYSDSFTLEEAETLALSTLKQVMEEKISADYVEVASVTEKGYKSYSKAELEAILARI